MSTIVTINSGDLITNSRSDLNTNFQNLNTDKEESSNKSTDTTFAANSDTLYPSQKAVKAYVDTGGNVNASTTQKGIVEEATQAEVDAGTAAGGTGARLFVNPSALPRGSVKSVTAGATINGATLPVPVYQNKTDNEFYACDANDTAAMKYLGFAISNGTDGTSMNVQFGGIVSGFSALDEGEKYYVSDTVGTIQNSPGTYEILVGVAISTTELLIQKGTRRANGELALLYNSANQAITTGFRPSKIRLTIGWGDNTSQAVGFLNWTPFNSSGIGLITSGAAAALTSCRVGDGSNFVVFSISSVTDTGFTIVLTETSNPSGTFALLWEAEGEL